MNNYLPEIREQYERYPFPVRRPEEERERLIVSELDHLTKIDHHGFGGARDFDAPFRVLVAGGGTGDALIFLAEQLRGKPAEFVFLDMSASSLEIARARAEVRGLEGITWVHDSLLSLERLGLGGFDYINCVGVLHHLEEPAAGLEQLVTALEPDGAMGLMLYGKYGRSNVYLLQELLDLLHGEQPGLEERVAATRASLSDLMRRGVLKAGPGALEMVESPDSDSYLVDTYLHGQDRAYSTSEIYELLEGAGLQLAGFTNFFEEQGATCALEYDPLLFLGSPGDLRRLPELDPRRRAHIAEILGGSISMHAFYASRRPGASASPVDANHVPNFATDYAARAVHGILEDQLERVQLRMNCGITRELEIGPLVRFVLKCVGEGVTTTELCLDAGSHAPETPAERVAAEVYSLLDLLVRLGLVTLRRKDLAALPLVPSTRPWNGAIDLRSFAALGAES